jgi:hypothetical protein
VRESGIVDQVERFEERRIPEATPPAPQTAQTPPPYATLQRAPPPEIGLEGSGAQAVPLLIEVYPSVVAFDPTRSTVELLKAMARIAPVSPVAAVQVVRSDASAVQIFEDTKK